MSAEQLDNWFKDTPDQTPVPPAIPDEAEPASLREMVEEYLRTEPELRDEMLKLLNLERTPAAPQAQSTDGFYEKNFGVPAPAGLDRSVAAASHAENIISYEYPSSPADVGSPLDAARQGARRAAKRLAELLPEQTVPPAQEPQKKWYRRAGGAVKRAGGTVLKCLNNKADAAVSYVGNRIGARAATVWYSPRTKTFLKYARGVTIAAGILGGIGFMGYAHYTRPKPKPVVNLDEKLTGVHYRNKDWQVPENAVEQLRKYIVQSCNQGITPADIEQRLKDASVADGTADNKIYAPGMAQLK